LTFITGASAGPAIAVNYLSRGCSATPKYLCESLYGQEKDFVLFIGTEELLEPDNLYEIITSAAKKNSYQVKFVGQEECAKIKYRELIDIMSDDNIPEEMIDPRKEGNPVAAAAYTSRIRIKQENKKLESLIQTAEKIYSMAWINGESSRFFSSTMLCLQAIQTKRILN